MSTTTIIVIKSSSSECLLCPVSPECLLLIHTEAPETLFMLLLVPCWNKKAPINHQISHRSSPRSRLTFILSHYSKIQLSAPTFSAVFALRNTWSSPFTAAEHWINLTSSQVWPSDVLHPELRLRFPSDDWTPRGCLELLWPLFIRGHDLSLRLLHININYIQIITVSAGKWPQYDSALQFLAIK